MERKREKFADKNEIYKKESDKCNRRTIFAKGSNRSRHRGKTGEDKYKRYCHSLNLLARRKNAEGRTKGEERKGRTPR
ncbi:MAG: hypothetical protein IJZ45_09360 [Bacteroidaceae bacterium]|nr:hypothetical protein [Bacteroidaceae bacterium]